MLIPPSSVLRASLVKSGSKKPPVHVVPVFFVLVNFPRIWTFRRGSCHMNVPTPSTKDRIRSFAKNRLFVSNFCSSTDRSSPSLIPSESMLLSSEANHEEHTAAVEADRQRLSSAHWRDARRLLIRMQGFLPAPLDLRHPKLSWDPLHPSSLLPVASWAAVTAFPTCQRKTLSALLRKELVINTTSGTFGQGCLCAIRSLCLRDRNCTLIAPCEVLSLHLRALCAVLSGSAP